MLTIAAELQSSDQAFSEHFPWCKVQNIKGGLGDYLFLHIGSHQLDYLNMEKAQGNEQI